MLLVIQFPISDSRSFIDLDTGMLGRPKWPIPIEDRDFVRSFGIVRRRLRGGISGWLGENHICEANRALRLSKIAPFEDTEKGGKIPIQIAYRRFYFDGYAVGKFEVGLNLNLKSYQGKVLSTLQTGKLFEHIFQIPVNIPSYPEISKTCELWQAGEYLAKLYAVNSTRTSILKQGSIPKWWVQSCPPVLFVEQKYSEYNIIFPFPSKPIPLKLDFDLDYQIINHAGRRFRLWRICQHYYPIKDYSPAWDKNSTEKLLKRNREICKSQAREIRLYLLRLHAERECLKQILANIGTKNIRPTAGSETCETLQAYLNLATKRISRLKSKAGDLSSGELAEVAREAEDFVASGERDSILGGLKGIRKNVYSKVKLFVNQITVPENPVAPVQRITTDQASRHLVSILFLAANPTDTTRLRLGEEFREIQEKLQLAKLREQFKLELRMSVRPADISQALLDVQPQILHFSGHGTATGSLCFENQLGENHPIQPDAIAALLEQFANQVTCVILNACYSEIQATAIANHIDYVIGMNQAIGDTAAVAFSIGFYQALGAGRTIEEGYKLGCAQISLQGISEHLTPVLIKKAQAQS